MNIHSPNTIVKRAKESSQIVAGIIRRRIGAAMIRLPHWRCVCVLSVVVIFLLLLTAYWQTEDVQAAETKHSDTKTVTKKSDSDKPEPLSPKTSSSTTAPDSAEPAIVKEPSFEEDRQKVIELLERHADLVDKKGHDDPEVQRIGKELDEAILILQTRMESEMNIPMDTLPAAPKDETSSGDLSKTQPPAKLIPPKVAKPAVSRKRPDSKKVKPSKVSVKPAVQTASAEPNAVPTKVATPGSLQQEPAVAKPEVATSPVPSDVKPTESLPKAAPSSVASHVEPTAVQPKAAKPAKPVMVVRPKPTQTATSTKPSTKKPATPKPPKPVTKPASSKVKLESASSKAAAPPAPKPTSPPSPTTKAPPAKTEPTKAAGEAEPNSPEPSPDDVVLLKIEENQLDVQFLIDMVAKELQLNIIYEDNEPVVGKVYIQQKGKIYRKDLQPLLEMILQLEKYSMIRDGSFIRIFKPDAAILKKQPRIVIGQEMPELLPGETMLTQIIEAQHVKASEINIFLKDFVSEASRMKLIAGTNYLIITEYVNRLPRILEMISLIDRPGPSRKLKAVTIQHIPVNDAKKHVEALLNALASQGATILDSESDAPTPPIPTKAKTPSEIRRERAKRLVESRSKPSSVSQKAAATPQGPFLYTYDLTSQLLVIGTNIQIRQVEELLALVDVESPSPEIELEIIQVQHVTASSASTKVKAIMDSLEKKITTSGSAAPTVQRPSTPPRGRTPTNRSRSGVPLTKTEAAKGPVFHLDDRTNRIFLVGYEEQIEQAKELLRLIDVVAGPEIKLEVMTVSYVEPDAVANQIQSLMKALSENTTISEESSQGPPSPSPRKQPPSVPSSRPSTAKGSAEQMLYEKDKKGPAIFVDKRTTRMFVVGSDDQIRKVTELLALLDVEAGRPVRLEILRVQNVEASKIASEIDKIIKALSESGAPSGDSFQQSAPVPAPTGTRTSRSPRSPSAARGKDTAELAEEQGPALFVDDRNNRLLVIGNDDQIEQVKEVLGLLDVVEGPEITIAVLRVQYVEASDVGPEIEKLLDALYEKGAGGTLTAADSAQPVVPSGASPRTGRPSPSGKSPSSTRFGETEKKRGPAILVDDRTNRLLIVGSEDQIDQVKELLALLDVLEGPEIKLVAVRVKYVLAADVADQVQELLEALSEQGAHIPGVRQAGSSLTPTSGAPGSTPGERTGQPVRSRTDSPAPRSSSSSSKDGKAGPVIVVDERTNRLLVVGSDEQIEQFHSILALLDIQEGPVIRLASFEVQHVIADDIATQLEDLLNAFNEQGGKATRTTTSSAIPANVISEVQAKSSGASGSRTEPQATKAGQKPSAKQAEDVGPFILVDSRTNRLLAVGSDEQISQIEELLHVLDVPPSEYYRLVLKVYQPLYVEAAEVQRIMDSLGITETSERAPRDQARAERSRGNRGGPESSGASGPSGGLFSRRPGEGMLLPGQEEPEVRMAVQETTNKIYILATEYQHRDIAEIMKHVDIEPEDDMGAIQIYPLENREPAVVKEMLDSLLEAEQEAKEATGGGVEKIVAIPGKEGAPIIVALEDIYAVAVRGSKKQHEEIRKIIEQLDKRLPSVLVEAILVQVNTSDALDLGVSLQQYAEVSDNGKRLVSGSSPFSFDLTKAGNMVFGTGGTIAYFDDELIFATLEALQTQGNSKIASMPRVFVNDNESGTIVSQREEPTITTTIQPGSDTPIQSVGPSVSAGTTLNITPHISEGDFLKLTIDLNVDSFDGKGSGGIPPPKSVNKVSTIVTVPNGKYIVLGGLTNKTESTRVNKVPLLGDIPILGMAFRRVTRSDIENVLYVFVKANIVGRHEEFEDLDTLSGSYRKKLRDSEINYQGQSVIPGIPEKQKERTSVLDD